MNINNINKINELRKLRLEYENEIIGEWLFNDEINDRLEAIESITEQIKKELWKARH